MASSVFESVTEYVCLSVIRLEWYYFAVRIGGKNFERTFEFDRRDMKTFAQRVLLMLAWVTLPGLAHAQFSFFTNSGTITITGYNTAAGRNMVIPSNTNGFPVTRIYASAFQFSSLTNAVIPNSITIIENYAFYGCQFLTTVTLPVSVTNLGRVVFSYCNNLTNISVNAANPAFSSLGGVLFDKVQATLIEFPCGLQGSYTIPGTVTSLDFNSFGGTRLSSVSLPASVTNMSRYVFDYCPNMTNFVVAGANPTFTNVGGVLFNKAQTTLFAFPGAVGGHYAIPATVTNIAGAAFDYSLLTSVILPGNLKNIDLLAFGNCAGLTSLIIPASVTNVIQYAFDSSYNLKHVYFLGNAPAAEGLDPATSDAFVATPATVFYMPGTSNWAGTYGSAPAVLWNPQASNVSFSGGHFQFNISMPSNAVIVVEACKNLTQPVWVPLATNVYSGSTVTNFTDAQSGIYSMCFYRLRSP